MTVPNGWGSSQADPRLIAALRASEGLRLKAYQDTVGVWTIGYGHTGPQGLNTGPEVVEGLVWTEAQAEQALLTDVLKARALALTLPEAACLGGVRVSSLIELVFNMGIGSEIPPRGWKSFRLTRAAIIAKDWQKVHDNLLASRWAKQVKEKRANRIANQFLTGEYAE